MLKQLILNPVCQGSFIFALMVPLQLLCRFAGKPVLGWNTGAVLILLFCLINVISGISADEILFYILKSAGILVLLIIITPPVSYLLTGLSLEDFGADAMIFLAPVIYYPVFIAVMGLIRLFIK